MNDSPHINPPRLKKLLRRLINIYSPSGKEEEILEFLHGYLKRHGLPVSRQKVDDNRYNLVVAPQDAEIQLALIGHLDTVTAHDLDDYECEEEGDRVSGLGAADMKGGCAAMVEAFLSLAEKEKSRLPVALALVVGEEEEGDGARELVKNLSFPWAVIGEPTDLMPCLSNYGYLEIQLTASGKKMHASLARKSQNPIEAMLAIILELTRYFKTRRPDLVYNIRELWSSHSGFVVPEFCETWLDVHLPPKAPAAEIMAELDEVFNKCREKTPLIEITLHFVTMDSGFEIPEKGPVVEKIKDIYSRLSLAWTPGSFRSHSDANQLWEAGVRPIILGPGELEKAHAPEESISFQQVLKAAELYRELAAAVGSG